MKINCLLKLIFIFVLFNGHAQTEENFSNIDTLETIEKDTIFTSIGFTEFNIIYRNYPNKINYACNYHFDSVWIEASGAKIQILDQNTAIVSPGSSRECSLIYKALHKGDTLTLDEYKYRVSNLPIPTIYLGSIPLDVDTLDISESAFFNMNRFFVRYPPNIPLSASFEIKNWTIQINKKEYFGTGATLSDEIKKALYESKRNSTITYELFTYKGMAIENTISINTKFIKKSKKRTAKFSISPYPTCTR
jgi:hypothetical protein